MPRVTKAALEHENANLRARNKDLEAELERLRARSRSPRRNAAPMRLTQAALSMVCREFVHDPVVEEQRAVIARQQREIQRLRNGEGPIGDVIVAVHKRDVPEFVDEFFVNECAKHTDSVADTIRKLERLTSTSQDLLRWGYSFWEGRLDRGPFARNSRP
jgi:hypothetical protein